MFSKFFIERPIFATVIAVLMVLAGAITFFTLPVAQYPDITPPTIMVSASYPGADAETIATTLGSPIEQQINGIEDMMYMSSSSSEGSYSLTITFEIGTDLDEAAVEVQNRIQQASAQLPGSVTQQGINVFKRSSNNILFCALESDHPEKYDALFLTNYANLHITDPVSRVAGVGGVSAFGSGTYNMRIWLDPGEMAARNLTPTDIENAIKSQNIEAAVGSVGTQPNGSNSEFEYTVVSQGGLSSAKEFGEIILRSDKNAILRLKDVARIELGSDSYSTVAKVNGKETSLIGVEQLPGANAIDAADGALKELDRLSKYFPDGVHYRVIMNSTDYVKTSIDDLFMTFLLTSLIVMIVILIFLQNWRAVIIPMITIPVSLIATFAIMKLMGFSLNTLTLFGLVLAIAIVVDDAIVVVEDCSRILDKGLLNRRQAAEKAMNELTGPVIGEVLVLLSVFIPTAFVSGITGQLYKQFALTIAVSTAFSGFNALTLTPALCALFLTPRKPAKNFIYKGFNKGYDAVLSFYDSTTKHLLAHPVASMIVYLLITGVAFWGFIEWPTSYIPDEDMGYFMTSVQLPEGASLERTEEVVDRLAKEVGELEGVQDVMALSGTSFIGGSGSNVGILNIILEPWKERGKKLSIDNIMAKVDELSRNFQEAEIFSVNPPAIPGLGMTSGLQMQLLDINDLGPTEMEKAIEAVKERAAKDPRIASVTSMYQGAVPQYKVEVNRDRATLSELSVEEIYNALSSYIGGAYVNDFVKFGNLYEVTLQADDKGRAHVDDLKRIRIRNSKGEMVPMATVLDISPVMGSPSVDRYNMYTTASVTATPAKNMSSSDGIKAMEEIMEETLGKSFSYAWTGEAYQETQSHTTVSIVFIFAIIMTILVLAAQYESWTDPIAVVLSMPIAVLGTILGCFCLNMSISIYTQIGLILLLGMSAKNAILIVEYAMDFRKTGIAIREAAHDAGVIRFRPIMMTACAFIFGVMPMMFATGAGANSRRELGTAVVFGMLMNSIIGTLFVPNFWQLMQNINEKYLSKLFKTPAVATLSKSSETSATTPESSSSTAVIKNDSKDTGITSSTESNDNSFPPSI